MDKKGYIYFMTNTIGSVLYIGVTSDLKRRMAEHKEHRGSKFTKDYLCDKLVYFEVHPTIEKAIEREKQLKHFKREWKNQLVEKFNPTRRDLGEEIICNPDV